MGHYKAESVHCDAIGESWEISDVPGNVSVVACGPDEGFSLDELIERHGAGLTGHHVADLYGKRFPLLIKIIDAAADLSIQVHPDDDMARQMGRPFGKNEMWIILDAAPGSRLACGFNHPVAPAKLEELATNGKILESLRYTAVRPGDAFFIPAGRIHAIGAGILLAEIQQTCDDTFRIYDYNRTDACGKRRALHLPQAARALDFNDTGGTPLPYTTVMNGAANVMTSRFFTVNMLLADRPLRRDYSSLDSFVIIMVTEGNASISSPSGCMTLRRGHSLLLPATDSYMLMEPGTDNPCRALEIYID